jgi:hypothetical protein
MAALLLLFHVPFNLVLALKQNAHSSSENVDPFHVTSRLDRIGVLTLIPAEPKRSVRSYPISSSFLSTDGTAIGEH